MTSSAMSDLSNLIERLEKAEGPDREIDAEISRVCRLCDPSSFYDETGDCLQWYEQHPYGSTTAAELCEQELPAYTASLDEALTLVPEGEHWCVGRNDLDADEIEKKNLFVAHVIEWREAKTPAIALCIAALKALEANR